METHRWYRLDNVGKYYSAQASRGLQTVFRYSAGLVDNVDPEILQHALDRALKRFPTFNVRLRNGLFWHYLEQSEERAVVQEEDEPICARLHDGPTSPLFRVTYYRDRINLEVLHMVSDGRGTLNLFKDILNDYIMERYAIEGVPYQYLGSDTEKAENSFDKFFDRHKKSMVHKERIYRIRGLKDSSTPTFMEYHVSAQKVLEQAHACGVSLTSYIIAAVICAIRDTMPIRKRNRAIHIDIPVDLRKFYDSESVRNFFGVTYVAVTPTEELPLEQVAQEVQRQLKSATSRERIEGYMNTMVGLEKNPVLRVAPSPLKDAVLGQVQKITEHSTTATVSSVGRFEVDERLAPYIHTVNMLTMPMGLNFNVISFGDNLSLGLSSIYRDLDPIENFVRILSNHGIDGYINIAGAMVEEEYPKIRDAKADEIEMREEVRQEDAIIEGESQPLPQTTASLATADEMGEDCK